MTKAFLDILAAHNLQPDFVYETETEIKIKIATGGSDINTNTEIDTETELEIENDVDTDTDAGDNARIEMKTIETVKKTIFGYVRSYKGLPSFSPAKYTDLYKMPIWKIQFVLETKTDKGTKTVILYPNGDRSFKYSVAKAIVGKYDKKLKFCLVI
ncbi:MAG: hypothetical protein FWF72_02215 [Paludibacter sp.]|nr:hypothetical protein [Paludibacter sp.]